MTDDYQIFNQDSFEVMKNLPDESFDMIFVDPPYMISNVGTSCQNGKLVSMSKKMGLNIQNFKHASAILLLLNYKS